MTLPAAYYDADGITIYHGDCREILPDLAPVDAIVTDSPYGISVPGSAYDQFGFGKGTRSLDFGPADCEPEHLEPLLREVFGHTGNCLRATGSIYAWVSHHTFGVVTALLKARGFRTRFLVWVKRCPPPAAPGAGWRSGAELCIYGYRPGWRWVPKSGAEPVNVLYADSYRHGQPGKVDHPTQKPLGVVIPLLRASTVPGDSVLDPFMGSGTTLLAAKLLGCRGIGIEIDERYCELTARRLAQGVFAFDDPPA